MQPSPVIRNPEVRAAVVREERALPRVVNGSERCASCKFCVAAHYASNGVFQPFRPGCASAGVLSAPVYGA